MRLASLSAALLAPALFSVAEEEKRPRPATSLSPTLDLLPEGSTLTDVRIPRYDKDKQPAALLRAGLMTVVTRGHITGENVQLHMFESDGSTKLTAHFGSVSYLLDEGLLEAREVVNLTGDNYKTRGTGAIFQLNTRRGFVHGPITTTFTSTPKENDPTKRTAMNFSANRLTGLALLGITTLAFAEPPVALTTEELAPFNERSKDTSPEYRAASAPIKRDNIASDQLSQAADLSFRTFAIQVQHPELLTIAVAQPVQKPNPGAKPKPEDTTLITCNGGMYFDVDQNHVVYLDNVVIKKPDFTLSAGKDLKIFLAKKPAKPARTPKDDAVPKDEAAPKGDQKEENAGAMGSFSDVESIVGTGGVKVVSKDGKGHVMTATADTATFDAKTGDIVLRGGFPTIRSGNNSLTAEESGLYIRIYANGNMFTQPGKWKTTIVKVPKPN